MSDAKQLSLTYRVLRTPVPDLLRGRVTGPVARRAKPAPPVRVELPTEAMAVVDRVVKRTRLWKSERLAVQQELDAHFADGLASGESAADLLAEFGDERVAAKLIRAAKKRNRPWLWQLFRRMTQALLAAVVTVVVIYLALSVLFFTGHPSPSFDYASDTEGMVASVPENERGWPLYRQAVLAMGDRTNVAQVERGALLQDQYNGKRWSELRNWLEAHQNAVATICAAADRPTMGFRPSKDGWRNDSALWPTPPGAVAYMVDGIDSQIQPFLNVILSEICPLLAADAKAAAEAHDAKRWTRDVTAMLNLSDQLHRDPLMRLAIASIPHAVALSRLDELLATEPTLLSNAVLVKVAHRLSREKTSADLLSYSGSRLLFHDTVQRMYTDDGAGDGRLTPEGVRYFSAIRRWYGATDHAGEIQTWAMPASLVTSLSRKKLTQAFDSLMDALEAELRVPIRDVDVKLAYQRQADWKKTTGSAMRFVPRTTLEMIAGADWPNPLHLIGERTLGWRDGVVTAIALELHHRRTGQYPRSLNELVPELLPSVPTDRITGDPVRFVIVDGKPRVYSVGQDRDDDGGVPPIKNGDYDIYGPANWSPNVPAVDGDWILFPQSAFFAKPKPKNDSE